MPSSDAALIADHWRAMLATNPNLFNGPLIAPLTVDIYDGRAAITVKKSDYASYMYARHAEGHLQKSALGTIFVSLFVPTSNNSFVVGRMASHTSSKGVVQLPGGGVTSVGDLRSWAVEEAAEELGLPLFPDDLTLAGLILRDRPFDVGAVYKTKILEWPLICSAFNALRLSERAQGKASEFEKLIEIKLSTGDRWRDGLNNIIDYLPPVVEALQKDSAL